MRYLKMKIVEQYEKGVIIQKREKLYRIEGVKEKQELKNITLHDKMLSDIDFENIITNLKNQGIIMDFKQVYIPGYPEVYAFMAPIVCPNGEHPDIAGGISLHKNEAIRKTIGESVERYFLFNFKKGNYFIRTSPFKFFDKLNISYFSPHQNTSVKQNSIFRVYSGYSLLTGKEIQFPLSFIYTPYKHDSDEDFIGEGTSTGCAAQQSEDLVVLNGIEEVVERHVNMKIWYHKLYPPKIDISTIRDQEIQKMISMLEKNGVTLDIFNTTTLNGFSLPSIMIIARNNAGNLNLLVTSSCKATLRDALKKSLEEVFQGQTWGFLIKKYPNFKPGRNFKNIKYFYQHILFYAEKKNEKYMNFLLKSADYEKYYNYSIERSLSSYKKLLQRHGSDCFVFDLKATVPGFFVKKIFITNTYLLNRDHNFRFLKLPNNKKPINHYPHPYG
ncbi:MAG: hypothetical protein DLD55_04750 [candidate division SR1 bacterium]|nr:MAG: hypothetical protein DLD55_04750 [candidate division SR1 bacterium]